MAWRETRGAGRHFIYFVACVTVGVAAIVAVGSFARSLEATVGRSARSLMGGDVEIRASRPLSPDAARAVADLARGGAAVTRVRELAAMAQAGTGADARTQLVELKAVEPGYPFYGRLVANPDRPLAELIGGGRALVQALTAVAARPAGRRPRADRRRGAHAERGHRAGARPRRRRLLARPAHADRGRGPRPDRPRAAGQPRASSHVDLLPEGRDPEAFKAQLAAAAARHRRPHHHLCAGAARSPPLLGSAHHVPGPHRARGAHGGRHRRRRERARLRPAEARHDRHPQVPRRDLPAGARHLPAPDHAPGTRRQPARRRPRQRAAAAPDALPHPALADRARRRHLAARHPPGPRDGRGRHPALRPLAAARDPAGAARADPEARRRAHPARAAAVARPGPHRGRPRRARPLAGGLVEDRRALPRRAGRRAPGAGPRRAARRRAGPARPVALARLAARRGQSPPPGQPRARRARLARPRRDADRRRRAPRVQPARAARDEERRERARLLLHRRAARPGAGLRAARGRPGRHRARADPGRALAPRGDRRRAAARGRAHAARGSVVPDARVRPDVGVRPAGPQQRHRRTVVDARGGRARAADLRRRGARQAARGRHRRHAHLRRPGRARDGARGQPAPGGLAELRLELLRDLLAGRARRGAVDLHRHRARARGQGRPRPVRRRRRLPQYHGDPGAGGADARHRRCSTRSRSPCGWSPASAS